MVEDCEATTESTINLVLICYFREDLGNVHCHIFFVIIFNKFFLMITSLLLVLTANTLLL